MARDNAACNRAIRKAWERERELVIAGKGTRNWKPEQREELISKGKVYDSDGKAFIGQHMKSASGYPEFQGDIDNIQLLSYDEHLEAHKGDWHNVTNWYYDPDTKTFYDFDRYDYNKFPPDDYCNFYPEEALIPIETPPEESPKKKAEEKKTPEQKTEKPKSESSAQKQTTTNKTSPSKVSASETKAANEKGKKLKDGLEALGSKLKSGGNIAKRFIKKHRNEISAFVFTIVTAVVEEKLRNGGSNSDGDDFSYDNHDSSSDYSTPNYEETSERENDFVEDNDPESSSKGTPKIPHLRHVGERKFKTKNGYVYHDIGDVPVNGFDPTITEYSENKDEE